MCRLTDLLMEKSGFCVYFLCSMGAKRVCECEYVNKEDRRSYILVHWAKYSIVGTIYDIQLF